MLARHPRGCTGTSLPLECSNMPKELPSGPRGCLLKQLAVSLALSPLGLFLKEHGVGSSAMGRAACWRKEG